MIQYTLAADREEEESSSYYQPLHPAIIRLLATVAQGAEKAGIPVGICGEMAGVPLYCELIIGMGYRELSMAPRNIPSIKRVAKNVTLKNAELLSKNVLRCGSESEIRSLLTDRMKERFPDLFPTL